MNILLSTIKSHLGFGPPGEVLNNEAAQYKVIQKFEVSSFWVVACTVGYANFVEWNASTWKIGERLF